MIGKIGVVLSKKTDKTALVRVKRNKIDSKYNAIITKHKTYIIHDNENECKEGMIVIIRYGIRKSKLKSWFFFKFIN